MRRDLVRWLTFCALAVPAPAFAQAKDKDKDEPLPRLGLDPAEPGVRSAPVAMPFGISPATSKEYVLDFHGYLLLPLNVGVHDRDADANGENGGTVLHTPALVPQDNRRFQYTGVVPDAWIQLNLTYGNSTLAGTVILASQAATEAEAVYDPVRQLGVSDAYLTLNLSKQIGIPFQLRAGATHNRYGSMGAFDSGRYGTPLIARINAVGETATASFKLGSSAAVVVEQGIGGQLGRMPSGMASSGWNDFASTTAGSSYVSHLHAGLSIAKTFQLGLHYATAWSQDDQGSTGALEQGRISVYGVDARLTGGRAGHLYAGAAFTQATNADHVSNVIEILNAKGGAGLVSEYLGEGSDGDGALTTFGVQYDMSLSRMLYGEQFRGKNPDVLFSLFGIGTKVTSDDKNCDDIAGVACDGVLKLKGGAEVTYTMTSWFGAAGRFDHVRLDNDASRKAFNVYTGRLLFHTGWQSRDEIALQYSRFVYGREVYVADGYPAEDDVTLDPDRHVFSLSATFWW